MEKDTLKSLQMVTAVAIFVLFGLGIFFSISSFLPIVLIPLIIINVFLLYANNAKGLMVNIFMFGLSLLLFVFIIEFFASILGAMAGLYHVIRTYFWYIKTEEVKKVNEKKSKK